MTKTKFIVVGSGEQFSFDTHTDAHIFIIQKGGYGKSWNIIEVPSSFEGTCDDLHAILIYDEMRRDALKHRDLVVRAPVLADEPEPHTARKGG